jgi:hypothetical protein
MMMTMVMILIMTIIMVMIICRTIAVWKRNLCRSIILPPAITIESSVGYLVVIRLTAITVQSFPANSPRELITAKACCSYQPRVLLTAKYTLHVQGITELCSELKKTDLCCCPGRKKWIWYFFASQMQLTL